jgi:protein-S-isoprenylcysteine O-methyltransferase Ste14
MSRHLPGALFALFTAATAVNLAHGVGDAVAHPSGRAWLVAGYWLLKTLVVAAFAYFLFVRGPSRRPSREPVAFVSCTVAMAAVVALGQPGAGSAVSLAAGEALAVASCVWLLASVVFLGRCFGVLPEARGLVTRGPYGIVRHPVYLGELGAAAGLALGAPAARNLIALAALAAAQLVRMRLEERALEAAFPEYAAYAARTPRLLPRAPRPRPNRAATSRPDVPLEA